MSYLTLQLLGHKRPRNANKWLRIFADVDQILSANYGTPRLGNFRDPVKEIIYIVLSAKTSEPLYQAANTRLWKHFRNLKDIANAPVALVQKHITAAGLGTKRATQITAIAKRLLDDFGNHPSRKLRRLSPTTAYDYLISLPGVGPKSALCVLMYSLDVDVFPVDANIHRIMRRMGAIKANSKYYQAQAQLPGFAPATRSKSLHVGLVIHGRQTCKPRLPLCDKCHISHLCDKGIKTLGSVLHSSKTRIPPVVSQVVFEQRY